ncbi:MAG: hypothetical protein QM658_11345 [Gordonia sp. (in: high G+C Gram-positive bacteria)]
MGSSEARYRVGKGVTVDQVQAVIAEVGDHPDDRTWAEARRDTAKWAVADDYPVILAVYGPDAYTYREQVGQVIRNRYNVHVVDIEDLDPVRYGFPP